MRRFFNTVFSAYSKSFYISIACILALLVFIFVVRAFSDDILEYSLDNMRTLAEELEDKLGRYTKAIDLYSRTNGVVAETPDNAPERIDVILSADFWREEVMESVRIEYSGCLYLIDEKTGNVYSFEYNEPENEFPPVDGLALSGLENGVQSGGVKTEIDGTAWIISYIRMDNGLILADIARNKDMVKGSNDILYVLAITAVFCLWLVQKNRKTGYTPFERISEMLMKKYKDRLSNVDLNSNRAAHALHMGLILTVVFYTFYAITVNATWTVIAVHTCIIAIGCSTMLIYLNRAISRKKAVLLVALSLLIPLGMHFFEGGFAYRNPGSSLLWIVSGILMALFLVGVSNARILFAFFIMFLFLTAMAEITILKNHNYELIFSFISGLFFLGFSLYASIRTYILGSQEDYAKITDLLDKLKASRNVEIQQAKMATLGQLIAGVSHEINTPIGAIQATGENMNAVLCSNLDSLFTNARNLSDDEFELLNRLINAARESMAEMKSTSELRKARREIKAYLDQEEVPNSTEIAGRLTQMEICDLDLVAAEKESFKSGRILLIMDILDKLTPIISGTHTILMATGKVSKIMFALKRYSYMSSPDRHEAFDIQDSIENILILHTNLLKSGITIVKDIAPDTPMVMGSADEIGQIWTNLIHNAVYAMKGVGTLTIGAVTVGNNVRISVGDTGIGIDPENMPRIFDAFYTSKPVGEGTGLGLDICRKIVENHQGHIWAESEVGKGTIFFVELPAAAKDKA